MTIAAGPRIISSTMGPVLGVSKPTSFDVTFDRPVDPQASINAGHATFTAGDVEVFYHDTTNGDASIPLLVTGVAPIAVQQSSLRTVSTTATPASWSLLTPPRSRTAPPAGSLDFTGTYSYVVAPDNAAVLPPGTTRTAIAAQIWSLNTTTPAGFVQAADMDQNADGTSDREPADHAVHGPDARRRVRGPDAPAHRALHVQRLQYPQPAI